MPTLPNPYDLLGVNRQSLPAEIRKIYRDKVDEIRRKHGDGLPGSTYDCGPEIRVLLEAVYILTDPWTRKELDESSSSSSQTFAYQLPQEIEFRDHSAGQTLIEAKEGWAHGIRTGRMSLEGMQLRQIPPKLWDLADVRTLHLNGNLLREFPTDLCYQLSHLVSLRLNENRISEIPDDVCRLTRLANLFLQDNFIRRLPPAIGELTQLVELQIQNNCIMDLPLSFYRLEGLLNFQCDLEKYRWPHYVVLTAGLKKTRSYLFMLHQSRSSNTLNLVDFGLNPFPAEAALLTELTTLNLKKNSFDRVPDTITNLRVLSSLFLQKNAILEVVPELGFVTTLTVLNLAWNKLEELPDTLSNLRALTNLDLRGNKLAHVPTVLSTLKTLKTLRMQSNPFVILPWFIGKLLDLERFGVDLDTLELPLSPIRERGLRYTLDFVGMLFDRHPGPILVINDQDFQVVPFPPCDWNELIHFDMSCNALSQLRDDIYLMSSLQTLDFHQNLLTTLPDTMSNLQSLINFDLSYNKFRRINPCLTNLTGLRDFNLQRNGIDSLPYSMGRMSGLTKLNLNHNFLRLLPPTLGGMVHLIELHADNNQLEALPPSIGALSSLVLISLTSNSLQWLPKEFFLVTTLTDIRLSRNRLQIMSTEIGKMKLLNRLELQENALTELPYELQQLSSLNVLMVMGNPLKTPPEQVDLNNFDAVMDYLRRFDEAIVTCELDLSGFSFEVLPNDLFRLTNLTKLALNDNRLISLPSTLTVLSNLEQLSVLNNPIPRLPGFLGTMTSLKRVLIGQGYDTSIGQEPSLVEKTSAYFLNFLAQIEEAKNGDGILDLHGWKLETLPVEVTLVSSLTELRLSDNLLKGLPQSIGDMVGLRSLWIDGNAVGTLPFSMSRLSALTLLDLRRNNIRKCPEALGYITSLEQIYLEENAIPILHDSVEHLKHLREIRLESNGMAELPEAIGGWMSLKELHMDSNRLITLPTSLAGLESLEVVNCRDNRMEVVPFQFRFLTKLRVLRMENNYLQDISPICYLTSLVEAWLANNQINNVPEEIRLMQRLQVLWLTSNDISALPVGIGMAGKLEKLLLQNNKIHSLPYTVAEITTLKELTLSGNAITRLPPQMGRMTQLNMLDLDCENMRFPPKQVCVLGLEETLAFMRKLGANDGSLSLKGIGVTEMPLSRRDFTENFFFSLTNLDASCNEITEWPDELYHASCLTELNLSENKLKFIGDDVAKLISLRKFWIRSNQLQELNSNIGSLTALELLDLCSNKLSTLPPEIGLLKSLEDLYLVENPIEILPVNLGLLKKLSLLLLDGDETFSEETARKRTFGLCQCLKRWHSAGNGGIEQEKDSHLHLALMEFPEVPKRILFPPGASRLILADNQISQIPEYPLLQLKFLTELNLSGNRLSEFPTTILAISALKVLNISRNEITELGSSIHKLRMLSSLDVGHNQLAALPVELGDLPELATIGYDHNPLTSPARSVRKQGSKKALVYLRQWWKALQTGSFDLANRNLGEIPIEVVQLTNLTALNMMGNQVPSIPELFSNLTNLKDLDLSVNLLHDVPEQVCVLTKLVSLRLSFNQICSVCQDISQLQQLKLLNFQGNKLGKVPPSICKLSGLRDLFLGENGLQELPSEIDGLRSLEVLQVQLNQLEILPQTIGRLGRLKVVSVENNHLTRLTEMVLRLRNLHTLLLSNNRLPTLPIGLGSMYGLEIIDIKINPIQSPPSDIVATGPAAILRYMQVLMDAARSGVLSMSRMALGRIPEEVMKWNTERITYYGDDAAAGSFMVPTINPLVRLDLSSNNIVRLPPSVINLTSLTEIDLSDNQISLLPAEIAHLTRLAYLNLAENRLSVMRTELFALISLESLDCSKNRINHVPPAIGHLTSLTALYLRFNPEINQLPREIATLSRLKHLSVDKKAFGTAPSEVVMKGVESWLAYLQALDLAKMTCSLDLTGIGMDRFPVDLFELPNLTDLNLADNRIRGISPEEIRALPNLVTLNLSNNLLTEIPAALCPLWTALEELELKGNKIPRLPFEFRLLGALRELSMEWGILQLIPDPVKKQGAQAVVQFLEVFEKAKVSAELDLSRMELTKYPPEITSLPLVKLNLSYNTITSIIGMFSGLRTIEILLLNHNRLKGLPEELFALPALGILDVSHNRIANVGPNVGQLTTLRELRIDNNNVTVIPSTVGKLGRLEVFSAVRNPLTYLPREMVTCTSLTSIYVNEDLQSPPNEVIVKGVEAIRRYLLEITNTFEVNWDNFGLKAMPQKVGEMLPLEKLSLAHNEMISIPGTIGNLSCLKIVNLSYNAIAFLPLQICRLSCLTILNLSHNMLEALPRSVCALPAIEDLNCDYNRIRKVPATIYWTSTLTKLSMAFNIQSALPKACPGLRQQLFDTRFREWKEARKKRLQAAEEIARSKQYVAAQDVVTLFWCQERTWFVKDDANSTERGPIYLTELLFMCKDGKLTERHQLKADQPPHRAYRPLANTSHLWKIIQDAAEAFEPYPDSAFPKMTTLDLSNNRIGPVPPSSFSRMREIKELILNNNRLRCMPEAGLCSMTSLTRLQLSNNSLESMSESLQYLGSLTELDLQHNRLETLPDGVSRLDKLSVLRLDHNVMAAVPSAVFLIINLRILSVRHNPVQVIPSEIGYLLSVEELALSHGYIKELPEQLYLLSRVVTLDLASNSLDQLSKNISVLPCIRSLDISGNRLRELPLDLADLTSLTELKVEDNLGLEEFIPRTLHHSGPGVIRKFLRLLRDARWSGRWDISCMGLDELPIYVYKWTTKKVQAKERWRQAIRMVVQQRRMANLLGGGQHPSDSRGDPLNRSSTMTMMMINTAMSSSLPSQSSGQFDANQRTSTPLSPSGVSATTATADSVRAKLNSRASARHTLAIAAAANVASGMASPVVGDSTRRTTKLSIGRTGSETMMSVSTERGVDALLQTPSPPPRPEDVMSTTDASSVTVTSGGGWWPNAPLPQITNKAGEVEKKTRGGGGVMKLLTSKFRKLEPLSPGSPLPVSSPVLSSASSPPPSAYTKFRDQVKGKAKVLQKFREDTAVVKQQMELILDMNKWNQWREFDWYYAFPDYNPEQKINRIGPIVFEMLMALWLKRVVNAECLVWAPLMMVPEPGAAEVFVMNQGWQEIRLSEVYPMCQNVDLATKMVMKELDCTWEQAVDKILAFLYQRNEIADREEQINRARERAFRAGKNLFTIFFHSNEWVLREFGDHIVQNRDAEDFVEDEDDEGGEGDLQDERDAKRASRKKDKEDGEGNEEEEDGEGNEDENGKNQKGNEEQAAGGGGAAAGRDWEENLKANSRILSKPGPTPNNVFTKFVKSSNTVQKVPPPPEILVDLVLDASGNFLREIKDDIAKHAKSLVTLRLSCNRLKELPFAFRALKRLHTLHLSGNPLGKVPDEVLFLTALTSLSMSNCGIETLPVGLFKLRKMEALALAQNSLEVLSPRIGDMGKLGVLNLGWNKLSYLPETIEKLFQLKQLYLEGNMITELPDGLGRLVGMNTLSIQGSQFNAIPSLHSRKTAKELLQIYSVPNDPVLSHLPFFCEMFDTGVEEKPAETEEEEEDIV